MATSIENVDKVALLRALWENAKPAAFFLRNSIPPHAFDEKAASTQLKTYIDYFCGRCIKIDLSGNMVDFSLYNRDVEVPGETIVAKLRSRTEDVKEFPPFDKLLDILNSSELIVDYWKEKKLVEKLAREFAGRKFLITEIQSQVSKFLRRSLDKTTSLPIVITTQMNFTRCLEDILKNEKNVQTSVNFTMS